MEKQCCKICNKELTEVDWPHQSAIDFIRTCLIHQDYNLAYTYEVVQRQLGYIKEYPDRMKKCQVCDCNLTEKEINTIESMDTLITCDKHRETRNWMQYEIAILWFDFKAIYPDANYEEDEWKKKFVQYRKDIRNG